jgi:signal transduction histidine kinase
MMIHEDQIPGSMGFPRTDNLVRVLLDGLPLAVCIHDETGNIVDYNAQAARLWGSAPPSGDHAGRYAGFQQLLAPEGAPQPLAASPIAQVIETGQAVVEAKVVGERLDGSFKTILISVLPLSEHGAITGAISCFRDIPAETPNPLDEPREWEMLSRLCGGLGHDLANLFQSVRLNVNLVERRASDPTIDRAQAIDKPLRGMGQAADRGLVLTRQLLAYAGRQHLSCVPTDINRLLAGMAPSLAALAGPRVRVRLRPASQLWQAHADPEQIKQAVLNVVTNACEAMKGIGDITIATAYATLPAESGVRVAGDYVLISIADTGPGMDRETLTSAFQPYFTTKKGSESKGLGLSTTLGIMRQHRGDIQVDSHTGQGTRVTLSLPRSAVADIPLPRVAGMGGEVTEEEVAPVRGKTVLVVDDDAVVRAAAVDMLESYGFDVLFAANGSDALGIIGSARPVDLILADFRLGGMNGIELVRQARALKPHLRAILISGLGDVKSRVQDDAIVVLQKPLRAEELLQQVRAALMQE